MSMSNIVNVDWVRSRILSGDTVIADVRFSPKEPLYGKEAYERGHLPGAVFVDFKRDLTDSPQEHGGRSPIPSSEDLAKTFGNLGIDRSTTVVVYEDVNGPAASRLWWLLKYVGVEDVRILDGGYEAWVQAGQPVTNEQPTLTPRTLEREEEIIVYCGSGISATPNVLALQEAGFTNVKLYAGSWSDWISYKDNPITVGEE